MYGKQKPLVQQWVLLKGRSSPALVTELLVSASSSMQLLSLSAVWAGDYCSISGQRGLVFPWQDKLIPCPIYWGLPVLQFDVLGQKWYQVDLHSFCAASLVLRARALWRPLQLLKFSLHTLLLIFAWFSKPPVPTQKQTPSYWCLQRLHGTEARQY